MTTKADAGSEQARQWEARLGWAFGLTADDPAERAAAVARLVARRQEVWDALHRFNEVWNSTLSLGGREQWRDPALLRAYEKYAEAGRYVLPNALWNRPPGDVRQWPGLPYALLFLEWEARFPQEWTTHAKKWGTKERLIRQVAVEGHSDAVRARLIDLVEIAVRRSYRCKDREYVRVARVVDGADLRGRLHAAARSGEPPARRHAGYVLWLLDRPEVPSTISVWKRWIAAEADR